MGVVGIILALAVFAVVCWKGWNAYIGALVASLVAIVLNGMPVLQTFQEAFIPGVTGGFAALFLVFFFGTIMGKIYATTGAASSIAMGLNKIFSKDGQSQLVKDLIVIIIVDIIGVGCAYGGINVIVLPVALYPLVMSLMEEADIPKKFVVGIVLSAIATAGMTGPGTPQVQNIIPSQILGTTPTAALIPGIICLIFTLVVNALYFLWAFKKARARGEHFAYGENDIKFDKSMKLPNPFVSAIPLLVVFILFNFVKLGLEASLLIGTLLCCILFYKNLKGWNGMKKVLNDGALQSLGYVLAINFMGGFGSVVKATPAFGQLLDWVSTLNGNALVVGVIATAIICGFTGSASGGLGLAVPIIAPLFAAACNPAALHRCMSLASSSLDTLPFNGGFLMFLGLTGLTHKEAYPSVAVTTVLVTTLSTALCIILCLAFPGMVY